MSNTGPRWNPLRKHVLGSIEEESGQQYPPRPVAESKTWETTVTRVQSWPEEAQPLKKHTWITYLYMVGDILLALLPIYFILLGIAVIKLNGTPTEGSNFGKKVEFAMDLGPTMFPIVFAAISGRSMKMVARYLAEKGARLSTLELLMASQSVWGTLESQLLMQRMTVVGINLLFLWALSPLGGQASLRLMQRHNKDSSFGSELRYMTTGPAGTMWGLSSTYEGSGKFADAGALYTAALLAPVETKVGPRDPWGNVKIPRLEDLQNAALDTSEWSSIPSIRDPETYSSLVGLPIVGLPLTGLSNFTVEYTYLTVECKPFKQVPYPGAKNSTNKAQTDFKRLEELVPGQVWSDKANNNPFEPLKGRAASFFIDTNMGSPWSTDDPMYDTLLGRLDGFVGHYNSSRLSDKERATKRGLTYVSIYATSVQSSTFGLNIAQCSLGQTHVEAMLWCSGSQCSAQKIRKSLTDARPSALTSFEHGLIMQGFAQQFPVAIPFTSGSSPIERFIANTSSSSFVQQAGQLGQDIAYTNLSLVEPKVFSRRLSLLINTYYQLTTQPTGYFGSLPKNLTLYGPDTVPVTDINVYLPTNLSATDHSFFDWWPTFSVAVQHSSPPFIGATTTSTVTNSKEIFVCHVAWLTLLMIASTAIFITGFSALVLKRRTLGPEFFGSVASMTYENPWIRLPQGATTLDAMERARLLGDVEVHVGDVRGDEDVGHIAFAVGVPLRKLERGRLYY